MNYARVIERANDGSYFAYVLDMPGCVACGKALEEVREEIRAALVLHIASLREHNEPVPPATSQVDTVRAA